MGGWFVGYDFSLGLYFFVSRGFATGFGFGIVIVAAPAHCCWSLEAFRLVIRCFCGFLFAEWEFGSRPWIACGLVWGVYAFGIGTFWENYSRWV